MSSTSSDQMPTVMSPTTSVEAIAPPECRVTVAWRDAQGRVCGLTADVESFAVIEEEGGYVTEELGHVLNQPANAWLFEAGDPTQTKQAGNVKTTAIGAQRDTTALKALLFEVMDVDNSDTRHLFIQKWQATQAEQYKVYFGENALDNLRITDVGERLDWILRWLARHEDRDAIVFPKHWRVSEWSVFEFCSMVSLAVETTLAKSKETLTAEEIGTALKATLKFEADLVDYFGKQADQVVANDAGPANITNAATLHKNILRTVIQMLPSEPRSGLTAAEFVQQVSQKFKRVISFRFDAYMNWFVATQKSILHGKLNELLDKETWLVPRDTPTKLFTTARDLFNAYIQIRKTAIALHHRQVLVDVTGMFYVCLSIYVDALSKKMAALEKVVSENCSPTRTVGSTSVDVANNDSTVLAMCCVMINTAEYCANTATSLQGLTDREVGTVTINVDDNKGIRSNLSALVDRAQQALNLQLEHSIYLILRSMPISHQEEPAANPETSSSSHSRGTPPVFRTYDELNLMGDPGMDIEVIEAISRDIDRYQKKQAAERKSRRSLAYRVTSTDHLIAYLSTCVANIRMNLMDTSEFEFGLFDKSISHFYNVCVFLATRIPALFTDALETCTCVSEVGAKQFSIDLARIEKHLLSIPWTHRFASNLAQEEYIDRLKWLLEPAKSMLVLLETPIDALQSAMKIRGLKLVHDTTSAPKPNPSSHVVISNFQ